MHILDVCGMWAIIMNWAVWERLILVVKKKIQSYLLTKASYREWYKLFWLYYVSATINEAYFQTSFFFMCWLLLLPNKSDMLEL